MRALLTAFLIISVFGASVSAECHYFRVSTKRVKCAPTDTKALKTDNPYLATSDVPELEDPDSQALVQVTCECQYSLRGSDPRCDLDQSIERSSILGVEDAIRTCRRADQLCRDVCPSDLP